MSKRNRDESSRFEIILVIIIMISIVWSLYCRLRVLEFVARR